MSFPYIDMHCDTLLQCAFKPGADLFFCPDNMVDISRMVSAGQGAQFFAVFFPPKPENMPDFSDDDLFDGMYKILNDAIAAHPEEIAMAYTADDIEKNMASGKTSAVLTIEDGRAVEGKMERLEYFYNKGVRAIALTWNGANCFGYPNSKDKTVMEKPLTDFGRAAIEKMNDLGIIIDVSHLSDGGFNDVVNISKKPFIASHSNCRSVCKHQRNLTDDMLRTLADKGGVTGLNFCPDFVADGATGHTTIDGLVRQVMHMLNVGGEALPAMGTDFDGIQGTFEIGDATRMGLLFDALSRAGMSQNQLEKFAYKNVLRVMRETLG